MSARLSKEQAHTLAAHIHQLRPDWDERGIVAVLKEARRLGDAAEVSLAAIRASGVATNRTPAVIAMPGPHWDPEKASEQARRAIREQERQERLARQEPLHPPPDALPSPEVRDKLMARVRAEADAARRRLTTVPGAEESRDLPRRAAADEPPNTGPYEPVNGHE